MTPERWQCVKRVFQEALEQEPSRRAAFLEEACAGDAALRADVEAMLASNAQSTDFMEKPAVEMTPTLQLDEPIESPEERRIGPYRVLREIGRGGMGAVYLAARDDDAYQKQVAIKLVKRGMDTEDILRRFRSERQILANLDHPNVAKLLDGGTTEDGLPYLIMDYVEGLPIDVYCDTHQLSIPERLELFRAVCSAVDYAHRRHVIHRDLKPSNILVAAGGTPKLLDFGIAKLWNPDRAAQTADRTATGRRLLTPEYASPEQVRGETVTAASDIYSLGVLLYELLTSRPPYRVQSGTLHEIERVICEEEPERPSAVVTRDVTAPGPDGAPRITRTSESVGATRRCAPERLRRALAGDLDNIVLMALRKEPTRRYASVEQFSEDIGRYLEGLPVHAHQDTLAYRTAKFIKRHKGRVIEAALIVVVFLLLIAVVLNWRPRREKDPNKPMESLAVLPLENLSRDPAQEYFADGMTDALITNLAKVGTLRVISRTSVMRYKGSSRSMPQIGKELNVDAVIEGSVQSSGDRVQVNIQLVHAATDRYLWAEHYERDLSDVLVLQNEVARAIAQEIKAKLTSQEQAHLSNARRVDPEAHEAYLKGRFYWNKRTEESLKKSIEYFQQAIEKDPNYARAYAGLADSYDVLSEYSAILPKETFASAKAAATKALEVDETLAEAHNALAYAQFRFDWDWPGAERHFRQAIQLNPGYATAHQWYANYLTALGRHEESIAEARRALELDPLSLAIIADLGSQLNFARRYDQAIAVLQKAFDLDPNYLVAHLELAEAYFEKGKIAEAIAEVQKTMDGSADRRVIGIGELGYIYAMSGRRDEARKILDELKALAKRQHIKPHSFARIYIGLEDREQALEWLQKGFEERERWMTWLKVAPSVDRLRADPRFIDLMRRVGLPP